MKNYLFSAIILSSVLVNLINSASSFTNTFDGVDEIGIDADNEDDKEWEEYKRTHAKTYTNELKRRQIWAENKKMIAEMNAKNKRLSFGQEFDQNEPNLGFTMKMNKYGDLSQEEFSRLLNGFKLPKHYEKKELREEMTEFERDFSEIDTTSIPNSVDWRNSGYVTNIRDQGMCGCCYIFAGVASLEGQYAKTYGKLLSISEQNFLNCVKSGYFVDRNGIVEPLQPNVIQAFGYSANGCNGGNADAVFQYNKYNGFALLSSQPYLATVCYFKNF